MSTNFEIKEITTSLTVAKIEAILKAEASEDVFETGIKALMEKAGVAANAYELVYTHDGDIFSARLAFKEGNSSIEAYFPGKIAPPLTFMGFGKTKAEAAANFLNILLDPARMVLPEQRRNCRPNEAYFHVPGQQGFRILANG